MRHDRISGEAGQTSPGAEINQLRPTLVVLFENRPLLRLKHGRDVVGSDRSTYVKAGSITEGGSHRSGRTRRRERPRWARTPESTARHLAANLQTISSV